MNSNHLNLNFKTMKIICSTLIAVLVLFANSAFAQSYVFKVLANKGENQVKTASETTWKPVKTGVTLNEGDELKVSENAYLGLVHYTGKTVELKKPEVIDINELAASLSTSGSSVASKYADFVLNKMAQSGDRKERLAATGAVTRATDNSSIKVFMPSSVEVLNPEAIISWNQIEGAQTYVVTLKNMFDEVILSKETTSNNISLNFDDQKLAKERLVIFSVKLKDDDAITSGDYGIQRLSGDDAKPVMEDLNQLKSETNEESSLGHIMLASFYEDNNLMVDAGTSYQNAIRLSPDVEDFKDMYQDFIERNGLNK